MKSTLCLQIERHCGESDQAACMDFDQGDTRQWTQQHLDAANIPKPSILALTPPQGEDLMDNKDVDVRGPGKLTYWKRSISSLTNIFLYGNVTLVLLDNHTE